MYQDRALLWVGEVTYVGIPGSLSPETIRELFTPVRGESGRLLISLLGLQIP